MGDHVPVYMVVVVGDGAVGKSAITIQLTQKTFVSTYDPTIENAYRQSLTVDGQLYVLDILDTAGQEEYSAMRDHYFRKGNGFLVVFSVISRQTFNSLENYHKQILRVKDETAYPMTFVANKVDMEDQRVVKPEEIADLATRLNVQHIETSAKTGMNVEEAFATVVRQIKKYSDEHSPEQSQDKKKKDKKKCMIL